MLGRELSHLGDAEGLNDLFAGGCCRNSHALMTHGRCRSPIQSIRNNSRICFEGEFMHGRTRHGVQLLEGSVLYIPKFCTSDLISVPGPPLTKSVTVSLSLYLNFHLRVFPIPSDVHS